MNRRDFIKSAAVLPIVPLSKGEQVDPGIQRIPIDRSGKQLIVLTGCTPEEGQELGKGLSGFMESKKHTYIVVLARPEMKVEFVKVDG